MSACCNPASTPEVILFNDRPTMPNGTEGPGSDKTASKLLEGMPCTTPSPSTQLLDGHPFVVLPRSPLRESSSHRSFSSVPPSPLRDVREVLADLGNRQEELFRQVLEEQRKLRNQLLAMQSSSRAQAEAWRAHSDSQSHSQQRQEDVFAEFRDMFSFSVKDMTEKIMETNEHVVKAEKVIAKSVTEEVAVQVCLDAIKETAQMVARPSAESFGTAQSQSAPTAPMLNEPKPQDSGKPKVSQERRSSRKDRSRRSSHVALQFRSTWSTSAPDQSLKSRLDFYLRCKEFEVLIALAIISHALIMCWECQYQGLDVGFALRYPGRLVHANIVWPGAETAFTFFDWLFGFLFLSEFICKLAIWRCNYFHDSYEWDPECTTLQGYKLLFWRNLNHLQGWNLLDFCCVCAFLFDKIASFSAVNPQMLRLLRLFRLFRLVRLLRWLESLDHLYVMTTAISGLSRVLSWAIILLTVMLLICNLFLVQILHATYFDQVTAGSLSEESLRMHHQMYEYFGTCSRCMLSMFEITLGNWPPVARLLSEEVSQWFTFVCVLHKLTIGFAVIGVITGIILQETFKVAQTDDIIMYRQKKHQGRVLRKKMQSLFDTLDAERDGKLNRAEFLSIGDDPEIKIWLASLDIETDDLSTLFSLIDEDGSGYITIDELVARMPRIKGYARGIDMLSIMKKFQVGSRKSMRRGETV